MQALCLTSFTQHDVFKVPPTLVCAWAAFLFLAESYSAVWTVPSLSELCSAGRAWQPGCEPSPPPARLCLG